MYMKSMILSSFPCCFLSKIVSEYDYSKFNYDHKDRFLVWHINYKEKYLSLSVEFVVFPFKCPIC